MLGENCRSSSSSCPSPPQSSSFSCSTPDSGLLQNASPRLSSQLIPLKRSVLRQSSPFPGSEKAPNCLSIIAIPSNNTTTLKSSVELRKEIATLEAEILCLERYLLSLYRTAFEEHLPTLSNITGTYLQLQAGSPSQIVPNQSYCKLEPEIQKNVFPHHSHASPGHDSFTSDNGNSAAFLKAASTRDDKGKGSRHRSLADHLGASRLENYLNAPERLSEDIVRCISSIYCKLASAPHSNAGLSASPTSSLSSSSIFSSKNPCDSWSPNYYEDASVYKGSKEERGPHAAIVEVLKIYLDEDSFNYAAEMLQNFRSLVRSLEKVDPTKMKREEKLSFWINIHNALVMHAYLAHGTSNRLKNTSILKSAYNVGGHCVDAYIIQSSILGIRSHHSAPRLQSLFSPGRKFKTGNNRHVYALEYPEPLAHFALCSGASSDPVVRVYTAKSIFHDLKLAFKDFVQSNLYIHKESKIYLPKIVYYFAKDMSLDVSGVLDLITDIVSEVQQNAIRKCVKGRYGKSIDWLPQSSTFRYLIHRELAEGG
ncbi:uncharacterized protein LOC123203209 isoform X2 [Mangifera indica]|uniref:uncharacterized protein LOC123203209 isoform X2 n=1 Tax=Mangifera indica TaxID=29780 RepID=UPI001CF98E69|nr:uncharacterized protein LOC123203209 isoform X2 [Mangifera indica]